MPIPAEQIAEAAALLQVREDKVPLHVRDKVKLCHRTEGNSIILFEFRKSLMKADHWHEVPIAKFKYIQSRGCWQLFWMTRALEWRRYNELPEAATFKELFQEVEADPLCCFWG